MVAHVLLLLAACVPPSVIGLRSDATMPLTSELSAAWGAFPEFTEDDDYTLAEASVAGVQARQRLSNRVAFSTSFGAVPSMLDEAVWGAGDLELQVQAIAEEPVDLQVTVGVDGYVLGEPDSTPSVALGTHLGLFLSRRLPGDLHPFLGGKINPVFVQGKPYPWIQYGGGLSWRPVLDSATRGLLAVEASRYEGFGVNFLEEGGGDPGDIQTWGFLVQAGASFGPTYR